MWLAIAVVLLLFGPIIYFVFGKGENECPTIQNLFKSFGKHKIIDNLNLSVPEGSVFGFIGKNGAGKTTTMKMVLGLLQPDNGEIFICDKPVYFGQTRTNQRNDDGVIFHSHSF